MINKSQKFNASFSHKHKVGTFSESKSSLEKIEIGTIKNTKEDEHANSEKSDTTLFCNKRMSASSCVNYKSLRDEK